MESYSAGAPQMPAPPPNDSLSVSSDSPGTATSVSSATTDARLGQPAAPPSVPAACLACVSAIFPGLISFVYPFSLIIVVFFRGYVRCVLINMPVGRLTARQASQV